jgi:hypothetical protein
MTRLPKLPTQFFSTIGLLPVEHKSIDDGDTYGQFHGGQRRIEIHPGMDRSAEWVTLWHEALHAMLTDTGANYAFTEQQRETICDAVGGYLTAMMQAGWLKVTQPKPTTGGIKKMLK